MRNLREYPITKDEVLDCLNRHRALVAIEADEGIIGSIEALLLDEAIKIVESVHSPSRRGGFQ